MKDKKICSTSSSSFCPSASYQKATKNVPEMSEQAVTYVDLKFNSPSEQQKKQRPKNTRAKGSSVPSSEWMLIIVILGIFCLALLIAVGFLSAKAFQVSDPTCGELENLKKEMEIIQGWKSLCQEHWFQRGKKCYLFSTEYKSWLESRKACSSHGSRLLLIEGKEELDFIHPLAAFHWIGLSRDKTYKPWMWGNGTALSTDWFPVKKGYVDGDCAVVRGGELFSDDCRDKKRYICEQPALLVKPDISSHNGTWKP
ncbi:natural killer cells antigen CD94-like [Malaclemys terrapin pileata]|uniref:natural killer cells antigen CD94-like n=1 Tax=Malaclemys terrapin pileata TaxID=2991368 RepID=UPI0023A7F680|nr:natural killer cells antigen CD94-like [Malaclemys terrapin pileata]